MTPDLPTCYGRPALSGDTIPLDMLPPRAMPHGQSSHHYGFRTSTVPVIALFAGLVSPGAVTLAVAVKAVVPLETLPQRKNVTTHRRVVWAPGFRVTLYAPNGKTKGDGQGGFTRWNCSLSWAGPWRTVPKFLTVAV